MSDRKPVSSKGTPQSGSDGEFAIACSEEGCEASTQLRFDAGESHQTATLSEAGWAVLNSAEDRSIVFLCPACFQATLEAEVLEVEELEQDLEDETE